MWRFKSLFKNINKEILPLRLLLFVRTLAVSTISPFLTLHMKDIGMNITQIGVISSASSVTSIVFGPISGYFIDRTGNYKNIFSILTMVVVASTFSLVFVPFNKAYNITTKPNITFLCNNTGSRMLVPDSNLEVMNENMSFIIKDCVSSCEEGFLTEMCFHENKKSHCYVMDLRENNTIEFEATFVTLSNSNKQEKFQIIQNYKNKDNLYSTVKCNHWTNECYLMCKAVLKNVNITLKSNIPSDSLTFPLYLSLKLIDSISVSSYFPLTRSIIIQLTSQFKSDYGKIVWVNIFAPVIIAPISGYLVQYFSYLAVFILYAGFMVLTFIMSLFLKFEKTERPKELKKKVFKIIKKPETIIYLFMSFIFGIHARVLDTYLFLFLTEIHATKSLIGWTVTVSLIPAMFGLRYLKQIIDGLGYTNVIALAFIYLAIRCLGYSFIVKPEIALVFEMFECMSHHVPVATMYLYSEKLSKKEARTTLIGINGAVRHGLGRILGPLIGAALINNVGYRRCFLYIGISSFFWGFLYLVVYHFFIKKNLSPKLIIKKIKGDQMHKVSPLQIRT